MPTSSIMEKREKTATRTPHSHPASSRSVSVRLSTLQSTRNPRAKHENFKRCVPRAHYLSQAEINIFNCFALSPIYGTLAVPVAHIDILEKVQEVPVVPVG